MSGPFLIHGSGSLLPTLFRIRRAAGDGAVALETRCLYPARNDVVWPAEGESWPAQTARHALIDDAIHGRESAPELWAEAKLSAEDGYKTAVVAWLCAVAHAPNDGRGAVKVGVGDGMVRTERAYAYDPQMDEARVLPAAYHRDYRDCKPWEIPASNDVEWTVLSGSRVVVIDWKTGFRGADPAAENAQLALLCLMAARASGAKDAVGYIAHVDDEGNVSATETYYSAQQLDQLAALLADLPAQIAEAQPSPGDHCETKFCKLRGICPAHVEVAGDLARDDELRALVLPDKKAPPDTDGGALHTWTPIVQSNGHALKLLRAIPMLKAWIKRAESSLEDYARAQRVEAPDGSTWGPVPGTQERLQYTPEARTVLEDQLGDQWTYAIATTVSKEKLEEAAKLHVLATFTELDRSTGKAKREEVLADTLNALRMVGATKEIPTESFKWRKPPGGDAAEATTADALTEGTPEAALPAGTEAAPEKKKRARARKGA